MQNIGQETYLAYKTLICKLFGGRTGTVLKRDALGPGSWSATVRLYHLARLHGYFLCKIIRLEQELSHIAWEKVSKGVL